MAFRWFEAHPRQEADEKVKGRFLTGRGPETEAVRVAKGRHEDLPEARGQHSKECECLVRKGEEASEQLDAADETPSINGFRS